MKEKRKRQKAKEIKNTVIEAKRVAAQLQLMTGQLDCLASQILEETKKLKKKQKKNTSVIKFY